MNTLTAKKSSPLPGRIGERLTEYVIANDEQISKGLQRAEDAMNGATAAVLVSAAGAAYTARRLAKNPQRFVRNAAKRRKLGLGILVGVAAATLYGRSSKANDTVAEVVKDIRITELAATGAFTLAATSVIAGAVGDRDELPVVEAAALAAVLAGPALARRLAEARQYKKAKAAS